MLLTQTQTGGKCFLRLLKSFVKETPDQESQLSVLLDLTPIGYMRSQVQKRSMASASQEYCKLSVRVGQ